MKKYPLMPSQLGVFLECQSYPGTTQYNLPHHARIDKSEDILALRDAWTRLIRATATLRTRFEVDAEGTPLQWPDAGMSIDIPVRRMAEAEAEGYIATGFVRPFDVTGGEPLFRVELIETEECIHLLMDSHHIIADGFSCISLWIRKFKEFLGEKKKAADNSFFELAESEEAYFGSEEYKKARDFFAGKLEGAELTGLSSVASAAGCLTEHAEPIEKKAVDAWCRARKVDVPSLFQAAFALALGRLARTEEPVYLTSYMNRPSHKAMKADGMFVNQVPMSANLAPGLAAIDLIRAISEDAAKAYAMGRYPFLHLSRDFGILPRASFNFRPFRLILDLGDRKYPITEIPRPTGQMDLCLDIKLTGDDYALRAISSDAVNSAETVRMFAKAVKTVLLQMLRSPSAPLKGIALTDGDEVREIMERSAGERLAFDTSKTWLDLFGEHAKKTPGNVAVADEKGSMTYGELDRASNQVANWLIAQGVRENDFVIVKMGRVKEFAAAIIGIHKAGAAYVPIDPAYPEERIAYMEKDAGAKARLTEELMPSILAAEGTPVSRTGPENYAYMIYTSGSTGKPKGTVVFQKGLMNFVMWQIRAYAYVPEDRISSHRSFSFDAHICDFYPPLSAGASVHIMPEGIRRDPGQIHDFLEKNRITGGGYTTALCKILKTEYPLRQRFISCGGEALSGVTSDDVLVYNEYGPTEFTCAATYFVLEKGRAYDPVPIGRPAPNCSAFILDKFGNLLPRGATGELCLAGPQLAAGYWNLPEKTAEVFQTVRLCDGAERNIYRTGDLARYNEDGELEYIGRIDFQVKLRGFRIELGEIDSRAAMFAGIRQAVSQVKKERLVLYYAADGEISEDALETFLAETLPDYMVPTVYMALDEMPLTPNGKINRKALPEPDLVGSAEYIPPETPEEKIVAASMQKVLGLAESIGALDSFYELGGDSIKAIRMASLIRQSGFNLQVSDIMREKTVRRIAAALQKCATDRLSQEAIEGEVPDTAIVRYFKYLDMPEPSYFNQATLRRLAVPCGRELVQRAVDAIALQHDMLRAVWREGKLFIRPAGTQIVLQEATAESREDITRICSELQSSIRMAECLVKIALIHEGSREYLFMAAHHLIVDGVSWRILAADLSSAIASLKRGEDVSLPMKTCTYRDYAEALSRYRDSCRLSREIPYWESVQRELLSMPVSHEKDFTRQMLHITVEMDAEATKNFIRANFAMMNADINDALLTAVCMSYHAMTGEDSVSVQLEGHGREDAIGTPAMDRTVGWFTSIYPAIFRNIGSDIERTFIEVKESLHRIPDRGVGCNVLRFLENADEANEYKFAAADDRIPRMGFNYLGEMDGGTGEESVLVATDIPIGAFVSPRNKFDSDIAINAMVKLGKFILHLDCNEAVWKREQAERFANGILNNMTLVAGYLSALKEKKCTATDLGENEWTDREFRAVLADFASRGEEIERIYPLTPMQEGMLYKYISEPTSWAYKLVSIYELDALPTEAQLSAAMNRLAKKHEALRTAIIYDGVTKFRQAIIRRKLVPAMADISAEPDPKKAAEGLRIHILENAFDLQRKPLFQITCAKKGASSAYLLVAVHHAIVDGWCRGIYLGDLFTFLNEEITGSRTQDPPPENGKYERAVREILGRDKTEGLAYWKELLAGYETKAEIPSFGKIPPERQSADDEVLTVIDRETTSRFLALCSSEGASAACGVELAWAMVLQTWSRKDDIVFAKVVSGRDNASENVDSLVGLFINSVPVRVRMDGEATARQMLRGLQAQAAESNKYDFCPLAEIQQQSGMGSDLLQSVLDFHNVGSREEPANLSFHVRQVLIREENFGEVSPAAILDGEGRLCLLITFDRALYLRTEIERVGRLFGTLVEGMAANPDCPVARLPRVGDADLPRVIAMSSGEKLPFDATKTWLDLFVEQARKTPDHIAVEDEKGTYSYRQLDEISDKVCSGLAKNGVGSNDFVAIRMGRTREFMAAVVGIWKAGAAYVPIDADCPADRVAYMLGDSGAKMLLTEDSLAKILEEAAANETREACKASPDSYAYMIYTSGSTGKPKGVAIRQRALLNFVHFIRKRWGHNERSRIFCHANLAFDASVESLYPVLSAGGTLCIAGEETRRDAALMREYIAKNAITGGNCSTQFGQILGSVDRPLALDYIALGGEKMTAPPNISGKVYNVYGPTEFTVIAAYHEVTGNETTIPIGRPLCNCSAFVLDRRGNLLPQGAVGELCLAGPQMAAGYWNLPEKTAEVFRTARFGDGAERNIYRTGDLARYNEDGELEYIGRIDFQVKLRGFRIELGEIDSRAAMFAGIRQAVSQVRNEQLILYYAADGKIPEDALRAFMGEALPDYMVPSVYMALGKMPMTPNGKIDRKALPDPELVHSAKYEPPRSPAEKKLCEAFARVLGLPENSVGRNDDFYRIGGNSLKSMLVMANAGIEGLSAKDIFKFKTAARIAEELHPRKRIDEDDARLRFIPATTEQIGMIDSQLINVHSTTFNLPSLTRFSAKVDAGRLADAVFRAAQNHPALSTNFLFDGNGCIVQSVDSSLLNAIEVEDISEERMEELSHALVQPFQIFQEPLFRARVFRTPEHVYLFTDMHHTISDGASIGVLFGDIMRAYRGEEMEQDCYYTYLSTEHAKFGTEEYRAAREHFQNLLAGRNWCVVPTPDFDSWDAAPGEDAIDTGIASAEIEEAENRLGTSKNVILITAAMLALREYCGETAVRVNFLTNNRMEEWLRNTVGLVFKIFPVAADLNLFPTGKSLLQEVSRQVTECFANSVCDYSTEENIPLRDALLINFLAGTDAESSMQELDAKDIPLADEHRVAAAARFDIYATDRSGRVLQMLADYQKNAYRPGNAKKFMGILAKHLTTLVQAD